MMPPPITTTRALSGSFESVIFQIALIDVIGKFDAVGCGGFLLALTAYINRGWFDQALRFLVALVAVGAVVQLSG